MAVAEHGSFSAAADHLGTVQSNISAHVARLERELGTTLVDRSAGRLTADGEVVVARAYRVMGELDALVADVGALREAVAGNVRVGIIGTTAALARAHAAGRPGRPAIPGSIWSWPTAPPWDSSPSWRRDASTWPCSPSPFPGRDLVSEPLFEEDIVLVVPVDDDPLAGAERIDIGDLERFELLLPAPGTPFRGEIDAAVKPAGVRLRPARRARRRAPAGVVHLRGIRPGRPARHGGAPPSAGPLPVGGGGRPAARGASGSPSAAAGLPSAPARAVLDALRDLMATPDRLPPGVHPVNGDHRARAEGSLRVVGMPNG